MVSSFRFCGYSPPVVAVHFVPGLLYLPANRAAPFHPSVKQIRWKVSRGWKNNSGAAFTLAAMSESRTLGNLDPHRSSVAKLAADRNVRAPRSRHSSLQPFDEEPAEPAVLRCVVAACFRELTHRLKAVGRNSDASALAVVSLARECFG